MRKALLAEMERMIGRPVLKVSGQTDRPYITVTYEGPPVTCNLSEKPK